MNERTRGVLWAAVTAIVIGFTYTDQASLAPLLRDELRLSDAQLGLLPAALFIATIPSMFAAGAVSDVLGPKRINTIGFALSVLGNLLFAFAPTFELLLAAKAISGIGSGIAFIAGFRYIAGLYGEERSQFGQGLYGAGYPLGSALGLQLMPPLALALGGWRGAFLWSSLTLLVVVMLWMWLSPAVPSATVRSSPLAALRDGNSWWCFVEHAAGFGLSVAAGTWAAVFLLREFDLPLVAAGLLGSILLLTAPFMRSAGGYLLSRAHIGPIALMRIAQLSNLAGLALLALPGRPFAAALVGLLLVGIGVSLPYAAVFSTASALLPRAPASAQTLTGIGGTVGAVLGAPIMGAAIERLGFGAAWAVVALIPGAALLGTFMLRWPGERG
ncbi:MAG: MFS transporter [Chloroflexi bacterium]|nr:MFS transporter [Chloroflexota bacterium]